MRMLIIISIFTIITLFVVNVSARKSKPQYSLKKSKILFNKFVKKYKRHYVNKHEENERYEVFVDNLKQMIEENKKLKQGPYLEIGPFSDMHPKEFIQFQMEKKLKPGSNDEAWRRTNNKNQFGK
ncbi:cathepsin propeptide inhibitor domain (I29) domain-containing protein [Phthorimaea operculella]|nr:cathepsin propeptide inhibitor domain (I29) domain-containing protein [Phthorimaea operculella]